LCSPFGGFQQKFFLTSFFSSRNGGYASIVVMK
jgi:hypothetical protein